LLIETCRWRIAKENSEKHLEMWREILDYQRSHPEKYLYSRSRILTLAEEEPSDESWMWIDEYEDRETYNKMMKAIDEDPEVVSKKKEWHSKWDPMRIPGSVKTEVWTPKLDYQLRPAKSG
jgi:hypothetical protein